jgi:hypothetical protein
MLAGHGSGHAFPIGKASMARDADAMTAPVLAAPMTGDEHGSTGMDMTVACLAVVAGLLLLWPRQSQRRTIGEPDWRAVAPFPARAGPLGLRARSLEELCISLT